MGLTQTRVPTRTRARRRQLIAGLLGLVIATAGCASHSTPEPAPTITTPSPAPTSPSPSPSPADFSLFTGNWQAHGGYINISADGSFELGERLYVFCDQNPPPCDQQDASGNITDGAIAHGTLSSIAGTVATGEITNTNDSDKLPMGSITFTLDPSKDAIEAVGITFCGSSAAIDTCGA